MKWFCADYHLSHDNVLVGPRSEAFPTIEEWDNAIIKNTNDLVGKLDTLFILGDFTLKNPVIWRQKIKCNDVWLIRGNHDPSILQCKLAFGEKVRDTYETHICGEPCFLSHYPHAFWPKSHRGSYHCFAHMHSMRNATLDEWMPERRSIDVCPENVFELLGRWSPINEEEIFRILSKKQGHDDIKFYENQRPFKDKIKD